MLKRKSPSYTWNICGHVLSLSFSKGSCGMLEFTDVDICLCKSVWPSAEDWISTSRCRLFQQMCLTPDKASSLSFLSFGLCHHCVFQNSKNVMDSNKKDQTAAPLFFQCISKFLSTVSQPLPIAMVKIESQSLSGSWLFSKFIFLLGLWWSIPGLEATRF